MDGGVGRGIRRASAFSIRERHQEKATHASVSFVTLITSIQTHNHYPSESSQLNGTAGHETLLKYCGKTILPYGEAGLITVNIDKGSSFTKKGIMTAFLLRRS